MASKICVFLLLLSVLASATARSMVLPTELSIPSSLESHALMGPIKTNHSNYIGQNLKLLVSYFKGVPVLGSMAPLLVSMIEMLEVPFMVMSVAAEAALKSLLPCVINENLTVSCSRGIGVLTMADVISALIKLVPDSMMGNEIQLLVSPLIQSYIASQEKANNKSAMDSNKVYNSYSSNYGKNGISGY